jgi:aromatic-amino-acid transaminase
MNAPTSSLFAAVELAPRDPILGISEAFTADQRQQKVNLSVGVYYDDNGKLPLLKAVKKAEDDRVAKGLPRGYQPIEGMAAYNKAVQNLLFGPDHPLLKAGQVVAIDSLGGTGGLKVGADYLRRLLPHSSVAISDPSWENHRAIFEMAGFTVNNYTYYDPKTHGLDFGGMIQSLKGMADRTIVVLHACCHNPTGVDLSLRQWEELILICKNKNLVPFLDLAYQGFGDGITEDAAAVHLFAQAGIAFLIASSFSKSFSLYGERVGALTLVTGSADESARVLSQIKRVIRTNYSNPPTHGAAIVAEVLSNPELRKLWEAELAQMRTRISQMRQSFVEKLKAKGVKQDFSFVAKQRGMFSYSGLTTAQVDKLRDDFGIYAVGTGRICVAALNTGNIDRVTDAIASVL